MKRIRVALFEDRIHAEPAAQWLRAAGVAAEVHPESGLTNLWFVSKWRAGARLEVLAADRERASTLLHHAGSYEPSLRTAIRCPECKSFRVDFPQFTEKSVFANLAMGFMAQLGLIQREYYCEECHAMWPKGASRSPRHRSHMAPDYFLDLHEPVPPGTISLKSATHGNLFRRGNRVKLRLQLMALLPLAGIVWASLQRNVFAAQPMPNRFAIRPDVASSAPPKSVTYFGAVLPILMGKCARCHNEQSPVLANWLSYEVAAAHRWEIKRRVWDSWHGTYYKQPMPTANGPEAAAITDEERELIRSWVENGAPRGMAPVYSDQLTKAEKIELGRRLFTTICAACHQPTGQGIPGRFPPLAGSDFLNADKHRAIKVVVNGLQGDLVVNGQHFNNAMPRFPLTDQDIASALTFVYNSFGNSGKEITPEEVASVRNEKEESGAAVPVAKIPEEKSPYE